MEDPRLARWRILSSTGLLGPQWRPYTDTAYLIWDWIHWRGRDPMSVYGWSRMFRGEEAGGGCSSYLGGAAARTWERLKRRMRTIGTPHTSSPEPILDAPQTREPGGGFGKAGAARVGVVVRFGQDSLRWARAQIARHELTRQLLCRHSGKWVRDEDGRECDECGVRDRDLAALPIVAAYVGLVHTFLLLPPVAPAEYRSLSAA